MLHCFVFATSILSIFCVYAVSAASVRYNTTNACNQQAIQQCMVPLTKSQLGSGLSGSPGSSQNEIANIMNMNRHELETQLEKMCPVIQKSFKCVHHISQRCTLPAVVKDTLEQSVDFLNDLCQTGPFRQEYLKHADCFQKVHDEFEACKTDFVSGSKNLHPSNFDEDDHQNLANKIKDGFCSIAHTYRGCIYNSTVVVCHADAAEMVDRIYARVLKPVYKQFECESIRGSSAGKGGEGSAAKALPWLPSFTAVVLLSLFYTTKVY